MESNSTHITITGLNDTTNAEKLNEINMKNYASTGKSRTTKRLDNETKETALSLFEQLKETIDQYDKIRDEESLSEHKSLLALKEKNAAEGERGGIGLRNQEEISSPVKENIENIKHSEEKI